MFQRTIKSSISLTGIGAHSGNKATLTLLPAPEHHGIIFKRTDLPETQNIIPALWSYVSDTKFCTTLSNNHNASVSTVEHLLAALAAKRIDNLLIEIDGPEIPILDGSAKPFFDLLGHVGVSTQKAPRSYLKILKTVTVSHEDAWAEIKPCQSSFLSLHYTFRNRGTNTFETYQSTDVVHDFENDLSSARTFGFLEDVQKLYEAGLAKGSSLENAVVFDHGKVMNPEGLRFTNECARHKALDVVGDLYLAGMPIIGDFEGHCSGHALNNGLLRKLLNDRSAWAIETENYSSKTNSYNPSMRPKDLGSSSQSNIRFGTY